MATLEPLHRATDPARPHVIFFHGLGGHPRTTWVPDGYREQKFWLQLRTNEQVGNLTAHNAHLNLLNGQFRATQRELPFRVRSFAETQRVLAGRTFLGLRLGLPFMVAMRLA